MMKTETRKFGGKNFHNQTTTLASLDDDIVSLYQGLRNVVGFV